MGRYTRPGCSEAGSLPPLLLQTAKEKLANVYVRCKNNVNYTNEDVLEATVHLDDDSWTVHEMATACLGRHISTGHRLMTYVDEIVYYESILTKGTVLEMVTSSAWQAAGCAVCAAHSAYLRRLCSATHRPLLGWPRSCRAFDEEQGWSLTAAAEREFAWDVKEKLCYIASDYDTVLSSTRG